MDGIRSIFLHTSYFASLKLNCHRYFIIISISFTMFLFESHVILSHRQDSSDILNYLLLYSELTSTSTTNHIFCAIHTLLTQSRYYWSRNTATLYIYALEVVFRCRAFVVGFALNCHPPQTHICKWLYIILNIAKSRRVVSHWQNSQHSS